MSPEQSGKEEYDFLAALVGLLKPRRILEINTSAGYGALALAQNAEEETKITTTNTAEFECRNWPLSQYLRGFDQLRELVIIPDSGIAN